MGCLTREWAESLSWEMLPLHVTPVGLSREPDCRCAEEARRRIPVEPLGMWLVPVPCPLVSQSMRGWEEGRAMKPLGEATV